MNNPKCPYCGAEMVLRDWHDVFFGKGNFFECVCGAKSPIKVSPDVAHAAAMQRWQEPNRVLTFDEVMGLDRDGVSWLEDKKSGEMEMVPNSEILDDLANCSRDYGNEETERRFGMYACCWIRRPTDEERASTPWAQNDA